MVAARNVLGMSKADIGWVGRTVMARIVVQLLRIPGRWSVRRDCSIVEHQTGSTTLQWLQIAVVEIVAQRHREIGEELVEERCTSFVTCIVEMIVASGDLEGNRLGNAASGPASVALHIAVLAYIQSLPATVDCLHRPSKAQMLGFAGPTAATA